MLRTLLIASFVVLALIAPVWLPVPAKVPTTRPAATRLAEDDC